MCNSTFLACVRVHDISNEKSNDEVNKKTPHSPSKGNYKAFSKELDNRYIDYIINLLVCKHA